jgi:hypothetical protein
MTMTVDAVLMTIQSLVNIIVPLSVGVYQIGDQDVESMKLSLKAISLQTHQLSPSQDEGGDEAYSGTFCLQ